MASRPLSETLWREVFGDGERPTIYSSVKAPKGDFAMLTSPKVFMKDLKTLSHTQLYALAENCELALKTAQDEYLHIERLIRRLEQKDSTAKPQALLDPDQFEEEKEVTLYGYKRIPRGMPYTRTKDGTDFYGFQEPFSQGGFVPTEAQYKRMKANAKDPNNIDDWTPIERDGKKLIPRMPRSPPPRQRGFTGTLSRPSRHARLLEQGFSDTDATAAFSDSDAFETPTKRATRFLGRKIPPTRDPSETSKPNRGSPAPHLGKHKLIINKLTPALMSVSASHPHSSPSPNETSPTPSSNKRRRITTENDHHNNPVATSSGTNPGSSPAASQTDPEDKKWTDASLISTINADHSFLHPDPAMALVWKNAILNAPNPVRSYAMKRKWAWWRKGGLDKRPRRGLREGMGDVEGDDSEGTMDQTDAENTGIGLKPEGSFQGSNMKEDPGPAARVKEQTPWLATISRPPKQERFHATQPTEKKQATTKPQQQPKDGQFIFKLNPPSTWQVDTGGGGQHVYKLERASAVVKSEASPSLCSRNYPPN